MLKFVLPDLLAIVYDEKAFDGVVDEVMAPFRNLNDSVKEQLRDRMCCIMMDLLYRRLLQIICAKYQYPETNTHKTEYPQISAKSQEILIDKPSVSFLQLQLLAKQVALEKASVDLLRDIAFCNLSDASVQPFLASEVRRSSPDERRSESVDNPMMTVQLDLKKHRVQIELENQNMICILLLLEQLQRIVHSQHVSSQDLLFGGDFNVFNLLVKLATSQVNSQ